MNKNKKSIASMLTIFKNQSLMWILLVPTVAVLLFCHWYPIFSGMYMSFFKTQGYTATDFVGLKNYINVLTDTMFLTTLLNTVKYVLWSILFGAIPPIFIAVIMQEVIHGKRTIRLLTYIPAVVPSLATAVIWTSIFSPASGGLLNYLLSFFGVEAQGWLQNPKLTIPLIMISQSWSGIPGTVLLYLSALQNINQDLYEAAMIDGASVWRRFKKITLPTLYPTILLMWVRQIIGIFQIMEPPLVMTDGGPNNASLSLNLTAYRMAFTYGQADRALALGVVSFCVLLIFSVFYFKMDKKINS